MNGDSTYDVVVVGLGAMGSAALYQLARRGVRVLGVDQFSPPHARGSSHGETRLTRIAIGEGRHYVPLAARSHEIWRELERDTGRDLLTTCGGLFFAGERQVSPVHGASDFIEETIAAAKAFGIDHEVWTGEDIRTRFPQFHVHGEESGYYEPGAGFVRPEAAIEAQLERAKAHGAEVWTGTEVSSDLRSDSKVTTIETSRGAVRSERVVFTVGPWVRNFLPEAEARQFSVLRQTLFWFDVDGDPADFTPDRFPVFIRTDAEKDDVLYGFPAIDGPRGGIKIASEQYHSHCTPEDITRPVTPEETERVATLAARHLRIDPERCLRGVACAFTVTPDGDFTIDLHPQNPNWLIVSPCSGHGFKHSAALGELCAELTLTGQTQHNPTPFRWR